MLIINQYLQRLSLGVGRSSYQLYGGKLELKDICEGLIKNHSLTTLDISDNNIGNEGAKHLANMLKINGTLKDLNLSNKYII